MIYLLVFLLPKILPFPLRPVIWNHKYEKCWTTGYRELWPRVATVTKMFMFYLTCQEKIVQYLRGTTALKLFSLLHFLSYCSVCCFVYRFEFSQTSYANTGS